MDFLHPFIQVVTEEEYEHFHKLQIINQHTTVGHFLSERHQT